MDLRNCPQCGKVFNFIRTNLCPECQEKDEQAFREIRKYITQHPGATAIEVSKNTGISEEKVLRFLREGRLSAGAEHQSNYTCELCGKPVLRERYCLACREKLTECLKKTIIEENKEQQNRALGNSGKAKMHTADLRKKRK